MEVDAAERWSICPPHTFVRLSNFEGGSCEGGWMISFTQQWIIGDMIGQVHEHAFAQECWPYVFRSELGDLPMRCEQESVRDVTKWWWVEVAGVRREKFEILRAWRLERHNRARALAQFDEWLSAGKPRLSKLLPAVVGKPTETEVSSSSNSEKPNTVPESIPTNTKWIPDNVRHVTSHVLVAHESAAAGSEPAAAGHISESGLEPAVAGSRSNERKPAVAGSRTRWKRGVLKRK